MIWSEGAIYNIGFERGLKEWRRFLKTGGYVAVSEASWFTEERPKEIDEFWQDAYPGIDTVSNKVDQMQKAGYLYIDKWNDVLPNRRLFKHEDEALPQHVHVVNYGTPWWVRHIRFRNYIRANNDVRQAYEDLKRSLAQQEWKDGSEYAGAKTEFIRAAEAKALEFGF